MKFTLQFNMNNAAFQENGAPEVETARILSEVSERVEKGIMSGTVLDINGNAVGKWQTIGF